MKNSISKFLYILLTYLLFTACSANDSSVYDSMGSESGQGGSMARFTLHGDYLYTVGLSALKVFDVSVAEQPEYLSTKDQHLDFGAETIFTMDSLLFIGSETGMYIYDISRPAFPQRMSVVSHIRSCDPVIAQGNYAYVTLNSSNVWCGRNSNVLQIYDISDPYKPILVREDTGFKAPKGLGISGNKLFICDNGLKVFNLDDPEKPKWIDDISHIPEVQGIETFDVIPLERSLLVVGADGFYQLDHSGEKLSFVSKMTVNKD